MILKRDAGLIIMAGIAAAIKIFSFFPDAVEKYYAAGIYPPIAASLRFLTGWIPFSIGDLLYATVFIWLLVKAVFFFRKLFRKEIGRAYFLYLVRRMARFLLLVYILFNILWGLNYNRRGIAYQLQLPEQSYSAAELGNILQLIVDRLNSLDSVSRPERAGLKKKNTLFTASVQSYRNLAGREPFFAYTFPSVKPSIFSYLGNYLGFTGYYNPFSGEAQINTTVPSFILPFTTCHEIGHQLGYAKENEANFAGYLSAKSSANPAFQYSVYFDLYIYAASELYLRDSTLLKHIRDELNPGTRKDITELKQFFAKYENPFEPVVRRLYGKYLKANDQPQGILSYNEVIGRLIAYHRKYGTI